MNVNMRKRIKDRIIRRANIVFGWITGTGVVMAVSSHINDGIDMIGEGIAFIIAGFVGLIMSFLTADVASGIKDTIRKDGEMTRKTLTEAIRKDGEMTRKTLKDDGEMTRVVLKEILSVLGGIKSAMDRRVP